MHDKIYSVSNSWLVLFSSFQMQHQIRSRRPTMIAWKLATRIWVAMILRPQICACSSMKFMRWVPLVQQLSLMQMLLKFYPVLFIVNWLLQCRCSVIPSSATFMMKFMDILWLQSILSLMILVQRIMFLLMNSAA